MMWRNYLKIALRSFLKQKMYSLINVAGLAIGLTAAMFIFLYVKDELSYDRFHEKGERIYRLTQTFRNGAELTTTAMTPYKIAPLLAENSPAVEAFTRLDTDPGSAVRKMQIIEYGDKKVETEAMTYVDSTFFEVFSFPLLQGNPKTALTAPNTAVFSESQAKAIFGEADPMGKIVTINDSWTNEARDVMITGIMKDMPKHSHFHYDVLESKATGDLLIASRMDSWGWTSQYSYIVLAPGHDIAEVQSDLEAVKKAHAPAWFNEWASFGTQHMPAIHLHSNLKDEIEVNGDVSNVYIFSLIGLFILLIASINYMNLATARAANRAREVGMRKVIGAQYKQLVNQFLVESLLITFIAFGLSLTLANLLLPGFNQLTGKDLNLSTLWQPATLAVSLGIVLVIGLFAGSYPAFFLASYQPIKVLKGFFAKSGGHALTLRKGLVTLQFIISIALIVSILVIYGQWDFLRSKRLGINTEQMLMLPIDSRKALESYPTFKQEIQRIPGVTGVTASSKTPLDVFSNYASVDVRNEDDDFIIPAVGIDENFTEVYDIEMVMGRSFRSFSVDSNAVLINEAAARLFELEEPIGQVLKFGSNYQPTIIGVVKDFNFESLHAAIQPMYFYPTTGDFRTIAVRVTPQNIESTIDQIGALWSAFGFEEAFSFTFLDEDINRRYTAEAKFLEVFSVLTALAIFIACLGLFGLAAFTSEQRTKEIGIRKVLGASVSNIVTLLSKDFLRLVVLAALVAFPISWWMMNRWLEGFAYRINISWWMFALAGVAAVLITLITVSLQAGRAASSNPINSLRSE